MVRSHHWPQKRCWIQYIFDGWLVAMRSLKKKKKKNDRNAVLYMFANIATLMMTRIAMWFLQNSAKAPHSSCLFLKSTGVKVCFEYMVWYVRFSRFLQKCCFMLEFLTKNHENYPFFHHFVQIWVVFHLPSIKMRVFP